MVGILKKWFIQNHVEEDIERRDFTVNGLVLDPETSQIFDYCEGIKDIESKIIRTIGLPEKRFSEDYLRMLRAIRFSNRFNFDIEEKTKAALSKNAEKISLISIERIRDEITRIIAEKE